MQSTVIELSNYTSTDTNSNNAEWVNNLSNSTKTTIEDGNYVVVKNCFLDTRQVQSGDIELTKQIEWTIEYGYYIINHGININTAYWKGRIPAVEKIPTDGQPYLLYNYGFNVNNNPINASHTGKPLVDSIKIVIPAGIYTRQFLATYITRQLQSNPTPNNIPLNQLQFSSATYTPQYDGDGNCIFLNPSDPADPNRFITSLNKPLLFASNDGEIQTNNLAGFNVYIDTNGDYQPCSYFPFLKDLVYDNTYESIIVSCPTVPDVLPSTTKATIYGEVYSLYDGCMAGASEMALEYDVDGSNRYQWTYSHTPLINKGNEVTGIFVDTANSDEPINFATKSKFFNNFSGIVFFNTFTNLTPIINDVLDVYNDPFFTQIGLNYDDMVLTPLKSNPLFQIDSNPSNAMPTPGTPGTGLDNAIFFAKTTRNLNPISNLNNSQASAIVNIYNYEMNGNGSTYAIYNAVFNTSTSTVPINFSAEPVSSIVNAGHYLVELQCGYSNSEYINNSQTYEIKAIVGSYFLSSDSFIMSNAPDSYLYQHRGEPLKLSSVKVRILNPITKQLATNIGKNSTVYLMITKEAPPPPPQLETPEKK
jgi:hypothetical protein